VGRVGALGDGIRAGVGRVGALGDGIRAGVGAAPASTCPARVPYHILLSADEALVVLVLSGASLLERLQELLDLLDAKPALPTGCPVGLEITHIGPAANRAERDPECVGGLRS
jgi:hypothetical protein